MRIISGSLKGKRITAPSNLPVRPTTDFAKEALFNIINNQWYFDEIAVLDLFSGIGSISLEFASRGAKKVTSVDNYFGCVKFLEETSKKLELDNIINTQKNDAIKYVSKKAVKGYDIVFADPPYDLAEEDYKKLLDGVLENGWLEEEGNFILEHPDSIKFEDHPRFVQHKKYGNVHFSFFE